jgi:hypothetical protein
MNQTHSRHIRHVSTQSRSLEDTMKSGTAEGRELNLPSLRDRGKQGDSAFSRLRNDYRWKH